MPGIDYAGLDGRKKKMSRPTTFPYAMTLRLSSEMETALEDLAYDLRLSRDETIRRILGRAIADAYQRPAANQSLESRGAHL
jgi:predicted transcriptional regulator